MKPEAAVKPVDEELIVDVPDWFLDHMKRVDLVGWTALPLHLVPYRWVRTCEPKNSRLMVIMTGMVERDGKRWLHVSFSRPNRTPSYADLVLVKERFIGADLQAITVHPRAAEHVSLHNYCLHLWCCLDGDGLPDFRHIGEI